MTERVIGKLICTLLTERAKEIYKSYKEEPFLRVSHIPEDTEHLKRFIKVIKKNERTSRVNFIKSELQLFKEEILNEVDLNEIALEVIDESS